MTGTRAAAATPTVPTVEKRFDRERCAYWAGYLVLLAAVLWSAANLRFSLPQTPIIDPDYWGYLHPAVSKLNGGPFEHTFGRNFVYPGFLYLLLRVAGDYQIIGAAQHGLGLLTGVLLAGAWSLLCGMLAGPRRARWAANLLGLVLAGDFTLSRSPLLFEQTIRPEAIFPFFLAASFLLNSAALHAGYRVRRPKLERWCLGLNFFCVAVAQSLKPSLGLGVVAANLPLAVYVLRRREPWRWKALVVSLAVGLTALTVTLPERLLAKSDPMATLFLPATLFTIHANVIHEQIVDDLRSGNTAPYERAWLAEFNQKLERDLEISSHPPENPYRTLGFNPDYLFYVQPVFYPSFRRRETPQVAAFCQHYYWKTWRHRPGEMLAKVGAQLAQVYNFPLKLGKKHRLQHLFALPRSGQGQTLGKHYQDAWACCQDPARMAEMRRAVGGKAYLEMVQSLGDLPDEVQEPAWVHLLNDLLARWHLPLLGLTLVAGVALVGVSWRTSSPLVAGVWLLWATNFLMFLTVAIVHSLEVTRYVDNQRVCTVLGEFATVLLVWQGVTLAAGTAKQARTGNPADRDLQTR